MGHYDPDGNFLVGKKRLRPYHLPIAGIEKKINIYLASTTSFIIYDPLLGWTHRPRSRSTNNLYFLNADGIRAAAPECFISKEPPPGTLRIALFGDSFTFGADVPFQETWGYYLQDEIEKSGVRAEVLNFGVGGYGMDQAYLRWKEVGCKFSPDIVIFGFHPENVKRNVNLIRSLYVPQTGIPFSKPRFVLEDGRLRLI
ncbi:MAG: SGNH/GDSL hydrolase family protein, partial [Rubrivivax sp.]|nr:SGNH/GDSL hydrolase family protein [Rubrivivax sp.]